MSGSLANSPGGIALLAFSLYPLLIDLGLLGLVVWRKAPQSMPFTALLAGLYLLLNVVIPLAVVWAVFRDEWGWLVALFVLVKLLEFGPIGVGRAFAGLLTSARAGNSGSPDRSVNKRR
jgi:hypothetical protein